jgi:hypothetical protein
MVVDVVAAHGKMWVKVIARKAQALHRIWAGKSLFGDGQGNFKYCTVCSWYVSGIQEYI